MPGTRKSIRLKKHDYTQPGDYFVTVCTYKHEMVFGDVVGKKMMLNDAGRMVDIWWQKMFEKYNGISMDTYIVMPNHVHGIISIVGAIPCNRPDEISNTTNGYLNAGPGNDTGMLYDGRGQAQGDNVVSPLRSNTGVPNTYDGLGRFISWFKRMSTNEYIRQVKNDNWPPFHKHFWQRNFYDRG